MKVTAGGFAAANTVSLEARILSAFFNNQTLYLLTLSFGPSILSLHFFVVPLVLLIMK